MGEEHVRAHVHVSGMVQGVFFRQETANRARSMKVAGWVRNLADGRVEAVFEGRRDAVESMVDWCRGGPRLAEVTAVEVEWSQPAGASGFDIV